MTRPGWTAEAAAVLAKHSQVNPAWCRACGVVIDYTAHVAAALADAGLGDARTDEACGLDWCCDACQGCGWAAQEPCGDCYGTGHLHPIAARSTHDEADAGLAAKVAAAWDEGRESGAYWSSSRGRPVDPRLTPPPDRNPYRAALADPEGAGQ